MKPLNRWMFPAALAAGVLAVAWVATGFVGTSASALAMSLAIVSTYLIGAVELRRDRQHTAQVLQALAQPPQADGGDAALAAWLQRLPDAWREPVRLRLQGQRLALPGPAFAPYLVGLLVMLGMLGTFVGMLMTFKGAVFALEGSADLSAIRSALAAPIKGLGLAFGTSVAGVATSAMLGLMSALARRERVGAARQLEQTLAHGLAPWSAEHRARQRQWAFEQQAQALPALVQQMQGWMDGMAQRQQSQDEALRAQQQQFHTATQQAYAQLAQEVSQALQHSLLASAQAAADGLRPVWQQAMSELVHHTEQSHQQLVGETRTQLQQWGHSWQAHSERLALGWTQLVAEHRQQLAQAHDQHTRLADTQQQQWDQRATQWLDSLADWATQVQQAQQQGDQQRQQHWHTTLSQWADAQQQGLAEAAAQAQAQQQAVLTRLSQLVDQVAHSSQAQAQHSQQAWGELLAQSRAAHSERVRADAEALREHRQRFDHLAQLWRQELQALRDDEAAHAQAAVARLGDLQAALAQQLGTLGAALEQPLSRLLQTAAEVPHSAAAVITDMRQEMARLSERDNDTLAQQQALVAQLGHSVSQLQASTQAQAEAMATLARSAAETLADTAERVDARLAAQAQASTDAGAHLQAGAIELASLTEAFQHSVVAFGSSNDKLVEGLQRVEAGLRQAMARSDEQLAYYVAQAREVIDLSLSAQQTLLQDLRRQRADTPPEGQPA